MKRLILTVACLLLAALLCACGPEEPAVPDPAEEPDLAFVNGLDTAADVWLLPQTEENLRTTVWGAATLPELDAGGEGQLSLTALGGPGVYILRVIDKDGMYYAADGVELETGCVLRLCESEDPGAATLEVTDVTGAQVAVYSVFAARL